LALIALRFRKLLTNPKVFSLALIALALFSYFHFFLLTFVDTISLFAVALATALARVASLETKLKTTTEALKDASTAKVSADKAAKAVETKAKKAKKALAEATQKQAKREEAVVERLDAICMSVGSKCLYLAKVTSVDMLLLAYLYFCDAAEKLGEVWKLWQESAKDPLLDVVEVLESNWWLARDVLQRTRHVLTRIFTGSFLRKKDELPADNLKKLVKAFGTIKDPILAMKLTSVKRGAEGMIALAQSHGHEVDWEKVGSSYAHPPAEMKEFFKKAKEYAPKLMSLILPAPTPSTPTPGTSVPSSSTPTFVDPAIDEVA
jgi:hypothetical protein